jgi:hypothetical protein
MNTFHSTTTATHSTKIFMTNINNHTAIHGFLELKIHSAPCMTETISHNKLHPSSFLSPTLFGYIGEALLVANFV